MPGRLRCEGKLRLFHDSKFFVSPDVVSRYKSRVLPYLLHDAMVTKAIVSNNVPAPIIPLQSNIRNYVDKYLEDHADIPELIKEQKSATIKIIQQILVERGIPAGLTYLAIVASELNSRAASRAGAACIWHMMPSTARSLGGGLGTLRQVEIVLYYATSLSNTTGQAGDDSS